MRGSLGLLDSIILFIYALTLVGMGLYFSKKNRTAHHFMVADRTIPAWAAGLAVMSAYTSSISYIATPGKAFDDNWHPMIFAICLIPIAFLVNKFFVPYYRKMQTVSVYNLLENAVGVWSRIYAALAFIFFMIGRIAVILYLASLLLATFVSSNIVIIIFILGTLTIIYTLLGGMEAVIWTDVMQSTVMIIGIIFCAVFLTSKVFSQPNFLIQTAFENHKFGMGSINLSLTSRTIWVMIIYGLSENLRNFVADQNYVQKYVSVRSVTEAKKSIWIAVLIYVPLTALFLYIGTALYSFYSPNGELLEGITKGDQVFPFFISTQIPVGLRGLIIAAIIAAAMSTIDSALNCSATVILLDIVKRFYKPLLNDSSSLFTLRVFTALWGLLGTGFALLMIKAHSALDLWWQIAGIFGGAMLGLFLLAFLKIKINSMQGLISIIISILFIFWGTFAANLPENLKWLECHIDKIIIGALGTIVFLFCAFIFHLYNKSRFAK